MITPPCPQGSSKEAQFMKWVWYSITGPLKPISGPSAPITRTVNGWYPVVKSVSGGTSTPAAPPAKEYRIVASFANYLTVQDGGGIKYAVAKPPELRCATFSATIEGKSITYTYPGTGTLLYMRRKSTFSGVPAYEGITPPYIHGSSYIYADSPTFINSVVTVAEDTNAYGSPPVVNVAGTAITLMDTNRSGRAWSVLADQTPPGA